MLQHDEVYGPQVCSKFLLFPLLLHNVGSASPLNPGMVKGYIHRAAGKTRGDMNQQLGLAVKAAQSKATTEAQRACIDTLKNKLFDEGNELVGATTVKMINMADSHSADIPSATMADVTRAVDAIYSKITTQWLPEKVAELNKC